MPETPVPPAVPEAGSAGGGALPSPATLLLGRGRELDLARELLRAGARLLTLTGPAGVGKTRLALAVAADVADWLELGARFVDLAPLTDPATVGPAVARALGGPASGGEPPLAAAARAVGGRDALLVLDNCEHLLAAASEVTGLLEACPGLVVLATSRVALRLRWEHELAVPPLALPDLGRLPDVETLAGVPAVALFVARARAARPDFALDDANAAAVAALCAGLDGLPLALELAAARTKVLPPGALLERLDRRLHLLTGGARDRPPRQRTLRAAVAWSHDLLDEAERVLFRRLAVFAGGCTLDAAAAVAAAGGDELGVLDGLGVLVDSSLVRRTDGARPGGAPGPRFALLETIREYAAERLAASGEAAAVECRHARHFLALAERSEAGLKGPDQGAWLAQLEAEHDNFRAVLSRLAGAPRPVGGGAGGAEAALRLAGALAWFWWLAGHSAEGRRWLDAALAAAPAAPAAARARARHGAGLLAGAHGDYPAAVGHFEAGLALYREAGDDRGAAWTRACLAQAGGRVSGDYRRRAALLEDALERFRGLGDAWHTAWCAGTLARTVYVLGDAPRAAALLEETLALYRRLGDTWGLSRVLLSLGNVSRDQGDPGRAERLLAECEGHMRALGDRRGLGAVRRGQGLLAQRRGDPARAAAGFAEGLALAQEVGDREAVAAALFRLGCLARRGGDARRAGRLLGAARAALEAAGLSPRALYAGDFDPAAAADAAARPAGPEAGQAPPLDEAVAEALAFGQAVASPPADAPAGPGPGGPPGGPGAAPLTPREREVAALVAEGLTNRRIAERLVITTRTADHHVASILAKLGFASRAQVAAWAAAQGTRPGPAAGPPGAPQRRDR
jgi:non-specific serine/threonine protein kinase